MSFMYGAFVEAKEEEDEEPERRIGRKAKMTKEENTEGQSVTTTKGNEEARRWKRQKTEKPQRMGKLKANQDLNR
jgi:hypothetical protein